jgi:nucleotide-binding universal stress UspA family protein
MRILACTDGSRYALAAARFLGDFLQSEGPKVDLVAVIPHEPKHTRAPIGKDRPVEQAFRGEVTRWLESTAAPLEGRGFSVEPRIERNGPARILVEIARKGDYDLVVAGAKGRGEEPFFGMGSVALALLEHAPSPLLLVRERRPSDRRKRHPTALHPFRVLVAADGSASARAAIDLFLGRFAPDPRTAEVVSVAPVPEEGMLASMAPRERDAVVQSLRKDARRHLNEGLHLLETRGIEATPLPAEGRPATAIVERAREIGADLVVLGSRGPVKGEDGPFESVSLEVARTAPCSVLIGRTSPATAVG